MTSFEVVLTRELKDLAILMGGAKGFHSLKAWGGGGGGAKCFGPAIFPFCSPPLCN